MGAVTCLVLQNISHAQQKKLIHVWGRVHVSFVWTVPLRLVEFGVWWRDPSHRCSSQTVFWCWRPFTSEFMWYTWWGRLMSVCFILGAGVFIVVKVQCGLSGETVQNRPAQMRQILLHPGPGQKQPADEWDVRNTEPAHNCLINNQCEARRVNITAELDSDYLHHWI